MALTFSWTQGKPAPQQRSEAMGLVVGGKLYVFSGYSDTSYIPKTLRADTYDPQADEWEGLPPMPRPMTHSGIATDGVRYIYLAGGVVGELHADGSYKKLDAIDEVWRYDTLDKVWAAMPSLPEPRGAGELALLGRTLHFFGGTGLDRYTSVGDHWTLDLGGGSNWETAVDLPNPRNHLADAVIDGKLYAIGGQEGHNETLVTQTSLQVWNPAQPDRWTELAPLPKGRSHTAGATVVIAGKIYLFGGEEFHNASRDSIFVYDPASNSWSLSNALPRRAHSGIAGLINGKLIYTTGNLRTETYIGELVP
jgi:N-acetylneuraminic acid mutarotase